MVICLHHSGNQGNFIVAESIQIRMKFGQTDKKMSISFSTYYVCFFTLHTFTRSIYRNNTDNWKWHIFRISNLKCERKGNILYKNYDLFLSTCREFNIMTFSININPFIGNNGCDFVDGTCFSMLRYEKLHLNSEWAVQWQ